MKGISVGEVLQSRFCQKQTQTLRTRFVFRTRHCYSTGGSGTRSGKKVVKQLVVHVSSTDSIDVFPENAGNTFSVELPVEYVFSEIPKMALWDINTVFVNGTALYLLCDQVEDTPVLNSFQPVLRHIEASPHRESYFVPCISHRIKKFHFRIIYQTGNLATLDANAVVRFTLILHTT